MSRKCRSCGDLLDEANSFYQVQIAQYEDGSYYKTYKETLKGNHGNQKLITVRSTGTINLCEKCCPHHIKGLGHHLRYVEEL